MEIKKFHLKDFPADRIRVPLKDLYNRDVIAKSNKIGQKIIWTKLEV